MGKVVPNTKTEEKKPINKKAKFIWFAIAMVIFLIGVILCKLGISFDNYVLKSVYAIAVFFPLLVAAQKVSCERYDENGKRNALAFVMYYFLILLFIVLIPIIFWVDQFVAFG